MKTILARFLATVAVCSGGAALAEPIPVVNGGFETTTLPGSYEFGSRYPTNQVAGWTTDGYVFVFAPGTADTTGATGEYGNLQLWGPNNGSANGLPATSPLGGNFIAADGDTTLHGTGISQTISGLTIGTQYDVSFYWAAAQQKNFDGPTTERWDVTFGNQTFSTPTINLPNHEFSGWMQQSFTYTATATTQTLNFLAEGTPNGFPPFLLLDGVSVGSVGALPEPATWAMMIVGLGAVGAGLRRRGRPALAAA